MQIKLCNYKSKSKTKVLSDKFMRRYMKNRMQKPHHSTFNLVFMGLFSIISKIITYIEWLVFYVAPKIVSRLKGLFMTFYTLCFSLEMID